MKKRRRLRKGLAMLLSLAMVAGLVPAMSGGANTVQAATGTGTEPSVSAYATKTQLMDGTFAPNAEGTAANYGKIVFGKNSSGNPQEWYILGKDGGVSGDNTIIFAASPIAKEQVFNSNAINKIYEYEAGTGYGESAGSTTVVANHYGASDLRVALQGMATNTSYFTTAEQGLMNATTVTTNDTKILNNSVPYTTTDKLYALQGDNNNNKYLWAGSSDSTVLAMSSYWSEGSLFWLRSPYDGYDRSAFRAWPGDEVDYNLVTNDYAVQPASNLNLKSVLFASSAKAASSDTVSGTLTDGTAMTLRINGTGKNIGTVTYNNTTGDIKATKGSTEGDVALVVQGNDETNDWYYSKQITGTEIVKVSDIVEESNTPSSIDLSTCKIWLEITDTDGMIYAVGADKEVEKINTTYVTKEQLMNSFKPYSDGTAANYGKIVFGKNSSGTAQEWYILGKDEGVSGDNTIIFAASPIATEQTFEDDAKNNKAFQSSFGVYVSNPSEVYPNHYGASDLRVALQDMATKASYFTTAEQGLMNATTVTTKDTKNSNVTYTTTDKLYALQGDLDNQYLWAGTSDSTVLAMNSYWSNGSRFRLRSPFDYGFSAALLAYPGQSVGFDGVIWDLAVQPASNLNLSSVLFASSAKAASSDTVESHTIASGTAMTLRLNGTGKNIGTVTYNSTIGDIKATKGSTEGDVALVVQGNDGINDWYYSKKIDAAETVNASDIMSALNLSSDIDLSACKIWLEITDTDGMIYAIGATEVITSVEITDIDTPVSNTALDTGAACATTGVSSTTPQITWTPSGSTAGYNTSYTASITLTADTGYEFTDSTTATVLGNSATSVTKNDDGTLTVTYAFPATDKDKLTSITAPQPITVANGTAYSAMNLPEQVNIVTDGNTVSSAPVKWDTTTLVSGSYDPAVLTEQTVTLNGTITCPDSIDTNGIKPNTTITITISAADIVKAPTANPPAGAYTENKSVTLTSDTEGATIYYTTDGSEPTLTGSTPSGTTQKYTAPISVTGTEGQSVQTTIKAIAVKDRMQNSSVSTFSYTIAIPDISFIITGRILTENGASIEGNMTGLANYKNKEKVTLNVPVIAGYNFVGWYVYSESSANKYTGENLCTSRTYTFTAEADRNLVAVYKPIGSAELTIDGGTNFTINGETKSTEIKASYPLGSQITVVCNSDDFEYWKNSAGMVVSRDKSYAFTVTGKETISAVFNTKLENKATVVFESYYGQVIARDQYAEGSTLAETPGLPFRYGYTALGWDYNGDGTYSASEDTFAKALERGFDSEDKLVKILPVYQLNETTYRITVENGTGAGNYRQNEVVTVVANAASEGNKFSHWADGDGNILSYNEKYQFYAAKSITVTAVYVEDTEKVEAKGTTEIVDKYADKANGKLIFVSMSTVPEGCTIDKAGIIATNVESVGTSGDGFNADTAVYVRGNAWTGNAYRFTWYKSNVGSGENWYVRAYLVYTDAEGNVNTVYGDMVSLTMPE